MITPTIITVTHNAIVLRWAHLTAAESVGADISETLAEYCDRTVQVTGTFGPATMHWQGSNDGINYAVLTDIQGNAISKTTASLEQSVELTLVARPVLTGADGTTDLTVTVIARRGRGG